MSFFLFFCTIFTLIFAQNAILLYIVFGNAHFFYIFKKTYAYTVFSYCMSGKFMIYYKIVNY